ncbi:hypothetical protein CMQ_2310 [Grosmannia clavigera kw1407]|uniref:Uncharacterized protein n=1 Tax=Grosmannia clavigera (strain kw1407 / UAMH 11150) TaxID=655863 RepID=F0XIV2_GROCL|nr:uncharacterized protein CMQ_2310 [Grosmannia clavigera kw1407]EFX02261.1 hypothetical protein CMQ_2310 [Grosmannia clavigera kw1407]
MPVSARPIFARRLTTSAQVHPRFLPYMHGSKPLLRGPPMRRLPAYMAVACIGYAAVKYGNKGSETAATQDTRLSEDRVALLDAYGGRESLEELEMASRIYSMQQQQGRK